MTTNRPSRRRFLKSASGLAAGAALPHWLLQETLSHAQPTRPISANDRPGVALVGCGGRGMGILSEASKLGDVVAVCDVDAKHVERAVKQYPSAKGYGDFRRVLERPDVHVVLTGTPDHWHTLVNVAAMRAGKDVYSEKPLTLTIDEGRRLVDVQRQTGRVLQTGSQQRSDARFRLACELVRNGRIGKLTHVTTTLPAGRRAGPFEPQQVPPNLDFDTWLGQTPVVPYLRERVHGMFRWWYEYSGGTMTDWGAHHNDIALWGMGLDRSGPTSVEGRQLVDPIPGGFTAASEYEVRYTYANGVEHTCRSVTTETPSGQTIRAAAATRPATGPAGGPPRNVNGVTFTGTDGWVFVARGKLLASRPEILTDPLPAGAERLYASGNHMGNFFDCVRSRKAPICEAEVGHRSASVCHLGVIAIRLGRRLQWDPAAERFVGDDEANRYVAREMRKPWTLDAV